MIPLDEKPQVCGKYISYIYRKSGTHLTIALKELGLSTMQAILLSGIYRYEGVNQCTLAQQVAMDTGVASRILRELELSGYIRKERDEQNRRNLNIFLTDEGRKKAEKSLTIQGDYWSVLIEAFTSDEFAALNMLLFKMETSKYSPKPVLLFNNPQLP